MKSERRRFLVQHVVDRQGGLCERNAHEVEMWRRALPRSNVFWDSIDNLASLRSTNKSYGIPAGCIVIVPLYSVASETAHVNRCMRPLCYYIGASWTVGIMVAKSACLRARLGRILSGTIRQC
jgi:hypothetical protein